MYLTRIDSIIATLFPWRGVCSVCCQVQFSVMGRSLVQRKPRPTGAVEPWSKVLILVKTYVNNIRNLINLNYPCVWTDDDFERKLKHVSMVPQEFGSMYVGEMDIKNWITETPWTNSSRQNLYQSLIQLYDYRSSIILEKPQWTKMVYDDIKRKIQWSSYSLIIVISLVLWWSGLWHEWKKKRQHTNAF